MEEENDEVSSGKGVEDMIKMKTLTQEKILRNLQTRYNQDLIYVRPPVRSLDQASFPLNTRLTTYFSSLLSRTLKPLSLSFVGLAVPQHGY
jgi:hypothetical protein